MSKITTDGLTCLAHDAIAVATVGVKGLGPISLP